MSDQKVRISHNEVYSTQVDDRLKHQEAVLRAQQHFQQQSPLPLSPTLTGGRSRSMWYNTIVYMTFFGFIGGLLAWAGGEVVWRVVPDPLREWSELAISIDAITAAKNEGRITGEEALARFEMVEQAGKDNPYMKVWIDNEVSEETKQSLFVEMRMRDESKAMISMGLLMGWCGALIAILLAIAEPVVSRNPQAILSNAAVGALLGLIGGVGVSLFVGHIYSALGGGGSSPDGGLGRQILARSVTWGILGLFLCIAPGVVMRSLKKLCIGLAGGMVGGLVGGLLFDPINLSLGYSDTVSRFVGLVAIGAIAGMGTGLIENAAKTGWLRVVSGLIAGKQFIVYRNPTSIGSSPQCEVYLFKDPQIAPRHAAVHLVPGGYDIEDLGGGGGTFINGRTVGRTRLRDGDQIQIGSTCFVFQEKTRTA